MQGEDTKHNTLYENKRIETQLKPAMIYKSLKLIIVLAVTIKNVHLKVMMAKFRK